MESEEKASHLYHITDSKILFLRIKCQITRINGEGQDNSETNYMPFANYSFIWNKREKKEKYINYEVYKREEKGKYTQKNTIHLFQ